MVIREEILYEILLDLHKAYATLDLGICLDIIAEYGISPWALRLLQRYWDHQIMVSRVGGQFWRPFQGHCGMTQWVPLSSTTFNVVADSDLYNWVSMVPEAEEESGPEGLGRDVQRMAAYFYTNNDLLASMRAARLQQDFHLVTEIFVLNTIHTVVGTHSISGQ